MKNRGYLLISALIYILLCFWIREIPFFWDFVTTSEIAQDIYAQGFFFFNINYVDSGSLIYSYYLSFCWLLFGKTLLVSHLALLPFIVGMTHEFIKLCNYYKIEGKLVFIGLLLLFLDPTISTQIVLMGFDIALLYLFIAALNAVLYNRQGLLVLFLSLLALFSMRGIVLMPAIVILDVFVHKFQWKKMYLLLLPFGIACIHFYASISIIHNDTDRQIVSLTQFFRNCIYIAWKTLDFGRVFLLIAFIFLFKHVPSTVKILLSSIAVFFVLAMAPLSNPICHRYYMPLTILFVLAFIIGLRNLSSNKQLLYSAVMLVFLLSGNFWIYPVKYGNGWDASLKTMSFFNQKEQLDAWLAKNNIQPKMVVSGFPLIANPYKTNLLSKTEEFADRRVREITKFKYAIYSNTCNEFSQSEIEQLNSKWKKIQTFQKGLVVIVVYQNPNF